MGFFEKIKAGLTKTRQSLQNTLGGIFAGFHGIDDDFYDDLEESLILADLGVDTAVKAVEQLREKVNMEHLKSADEVREALKDILVEMLNVGDTQLKLTTQPSIVLVIGVNGVGKTTTIGKLAHQMKNDGKKVLLCAADTFRAAAAEQLQQWGERIGVRVIRHEEGTDPSAVIYDSIQAAKAAGTDVLICDTAGRLQNKKNLMKELEKMNRIIDREYPEAHRETLLVLDSTTGKNAVSQAQEFSEIAEITGLVLTKLDGTARGGIAITVTDQFDIPIKYIGVGEGIDDLLEFNPTQFAEEIFDE